ncbi:MAG TPA: dephospho-CoA kinase [Bacteroidia bacterium]|jgi:dephospho-CoA kinase
MLKIGITGGIGSGKSTVCRVFELLGIPVYYADTESKKLLSDAIVKAAILKLFGNSVLDEQKNIDRRKIAAQVFNDTAALENLNAILHPAVGIHFENWLKKQHSPYVIKEAAILFESGAYKQVDQVIAVTAPLELKLKRTINRDKVSREEVLQRMNHQMSDEEKIKRSQFVINNDEKELLIPQVLEIHYKLLPG